QVAGAVEAMEARAPLELGDRDLRGQLVPVVADREERVAEGVVGEGGSAVGEGLRVADRRGEAEGAEVDEIGWRDAPRPPRRASGGRRAATQEEEQGKRREQGRAPHVGDASGFRGHRGRPYEALGR